MKQLNDMFLKARKEHDVRKMKILSALVSEVRAVGKNNGNRETTDQEAIKVIEKFRKGVVETLSLIGDKQSEKVEELKEELEIYDSLLPKKMTDQELEREIGLFLGQHPEANIGQIMKHLKSNFEGMYDGRRASAIAKDVLSS
jgi:uncharacterized protein YqeY